MQQGDKYCSGCGALLEAREAAGRLRPVCSQCGRVVFYDPKVVAVTVVERAGQVLMVRRAGDPRLRFMERAGRLRGPGRSGRSGGGPGGS